MCIIGMVHKALPRQQCAQGSRTSVKRKKVLQGSKASWMPCLRKGQREGEGRKRTKTDQQWLEGGGAAALCSIWGRDRSGKRKEGASGGWMERCVDVGWGGEGGDE